MHEIQPTWPEDMLVLKAAYAALQQADGIKLDDLEGATGLGREFIYWSVARLRDAGYFSGGQIHGVGINLMLQKANLTERGRRLVGEWPSLDVFQERLIAALEQEAEQQTDPSLKGALSTASRWLSSAVGKAMIGEAVGKLL